MVRHAIGVVILPSKSFEGQGLASLVSEDDRSRCLGWLLTANVDTSKRDSSLIDCKITSRRDSSSSQGGNSALKIARRCADTHIKSASLASWGKRTTICIFVCY